MGDPTEHTPDQELFDRIQQLEESVKREKNLNAAIRNLLGNGAAYVGPEFFPAVVKNLASVLEAEYVFIGRLLEESNSIETVALWGMGQLRPNITYSLLNTPCADVLREKVCVHPAEVTSKFPADQLLIDMQIEGYVGIPLFDSTGASLGIIVALYQHPVPDGDFASTVMLVFTARVAAEMTRVNQEEARLKLEENLLQAQKLEGLGVLAGGIAHDFNNILMTILASADLAELKLDANHPAIEQIRLIGKTAGQAGELCRQLLAYAGKGQIELIAQDLSLIVKDLEQLLQTSATSQASLELDLQTGLPSVCVDVSQIRQVLLNLVVNASEAMEGRAGTIRIATGVMTVDHAYQATSQHEFSDGPGEYVFLEVTDTGVGMPPNVLDKIFDPFFSTKFTGRGLGLAATLGIMKSHSGTIKVNSTPGSGTQFRVLLPAQRETVTAPETFTESDWKGEGTALIVDDQLHIRRVAAQLMAVLGFDALTAEDGVEGLKLLEQHQEKIRVVLLDLTMPKMGGEETFLAMREIRQDTPVILMSGFNEGGSIGQYVETGQASFLQKPFKLQELRCKVRDAIKAVRAAQLND